MTTKKNKKDQQASPERVRLAELQEAMRPLRPVDDNQHINETPTQMNVLVFTITGKEDITVDEYGNEDQKGYPALVDRKDRLGQNIPAETLDEAYAKSANNGRMTYYWIKRGPNGQIYNPIGPQDELRSTKSRIPGIEIWKFDRTNRNVFLHYLNFLKTKNQAWLITAQRELP